MEQPTQQPASQQPPLIVYVMFTAEIIPKTVESMIQALSNMAQQGVQEVYLAFRRLAETLLLASRFITSFGEFLLNSSLTTSVTSIL